MRRSSSNWQFLLKVLASYMDEPRPLPTILSFNAEAFVKRNSDISPCEADRRKSRPIHHRAHLFFVEDMVTVENGGECGVMNRSFSRFFLAACFEFRHWHGREEALASYRQAPEQSPPARNYRIGK